MRQARLHAIRKISPFKINAIFTRFNTRHPLPPKQTKVLRMLLGIGGGRKLAIETVADCLHRCAAAKLARVGPIFTGDRAGGQPSRVEPQLGGILRNLVIRFVKHPPEIELRVVKAVDRGDRSPISHVRHMRVIGRQKSDPKIVLEERVHAVQRAPRSASRDRNTRVSHDDPQIFLAKRPDIKTDVTLSHGGARTDENMSGSVTGVVDDRQLNATGPLVIALKLLCRKTLALDGVRPDNDVPFVKRGKIDTRGDRFGDEGGLEKGDNQ